MDRAEYTEPIKAEAPIPVLLDTIDKQSAMVAEAVRALAEQLDKALRPDDTESTVGRDVPRERVGGSNLATRLGSISSNLGDLGIYLNRLMARLEL